MNLKRNTPKSLKDGAKLNELMFFSKEESNCFIRIKVNSISIIASELED